MGTRSAERSQWDPDCGCPTKRHLSCHLKDQKELTTYDEHARTRGGYARQKRQQGLSPRGRSKQVHSKDSR